MSTTDLRENDVVDAAAELPDIRTLKLPQMDIRQARITCTGMSPLIMHKWSVKAQREMEDKQQKVAKDQKEARDKEQEWLDACYVVPGREDMDDWTVGKYYFPGSAFKHAFLYGVSLLGDTKGMPKVKATGYLFINDDPILEFEKVELRTDVGRVGAGTSSPVYRPCFYGWSVDLDVTYDGKAIALEQVVTLLDRGGFGGGVGDWRPSAPKNKSGSFGRFRVSGVSEIRKEQDAE